jgi:DNA-binding FrmR family transcriptional regulator
MIDVIKKRAIHRSRILQGQLNGLEKMIEKEEYCTDILTQSLAIQKSLASLDKLILENHLRTHVKDMFVSGVTDKAVDELLHLYELSTIRGKK